MPFIDVLIVIVIFLAVTTTYSRYSELQINLPTADANRPADRPNQVNVGDIGYRPVRGQSPPVTFTTREAFANELRRAASGNSDPVIIINADANATHQSVIQRHGSRTDRGLRQDHVYHPTASLTGPLAAGYPR